MNNLDVNFDLQTLHISELADDTCGVAWGELGRASAGGAVGGALAGGATGAIAGSIAPGPGTLAGAGVGALAGGAGGAVSGAVNNFGQQMGWWK